MLHVILLILKILGIIFLVAVGLFLLFVYAVFFSAIPYRIEVRKKEAVRMSVFASWFFRIITVRFRMDSENGWEPVFQMRFFGFLLWQNVEEGARWRRLKKFQRWLKKKFQSRWRRKKAADQAKEKPEPVLEASAGEEPVQSMEEPADHPDESTARETPKAKEPEENDVLYSEQKKETVPTGHTGRRRNAEKKTVFEKAGYAIRGVCDKIKQIWKKITGLWDTVRKIRKRKDALLEFWNLEEHRRAREAVLGEVRYLWKKLRPGKAAGRITFGFSDPADTGLCMGAAGMLCAWYPKKLKIVPDFDREILEGELLLKGKARFYVIVRVLWRIYTNEDIHSMYRHWQEL